MLHDAACKNARSVLAFLHLLVLVRCLTGEQFYKETQINEAPAPSELAASCGQVNGIIATSVKTESSRPIGGWLPGILGWLSHDSRRWSVGYAAEAWKKTGCMLHAELLS